MNTGGGAWGGRSFAGVLAGCLSLGLFFCWINFGGFSGDAVFVVLSANRFPHDLAVRLATGGTFLALSFAPALLRREKACSIACGLMAALSVVIRWCASLLGTAALLVGAVMAGVSLALFLCLWLGRYKRDFGGMVVMMLLTATVTNLLYPTALALGGHVVDVAALLFPCLALLLLAYGPSGSGACANGVPSGMRRANKAGFALQAVALLLCNFASGPASYGASSSAQLTIQLGAAASLALCLAFILYRQPKDETLLALAALVVCACIAPMLFCAVVPVWLSSLSAAVFWMITKYSLAWFTFYGSLKGEGLSATSLRGLAATYVVTALATVVGQTIQGRIACVVALVMVGVALAVALINATRTPLPVASDTSGPDGEEQRPLPDLPMKDDEHVVALLAERSGLTDGERGVFGCLARGYTLRQVSRELGITEGTAKYHRHNVYQKLGVASREELIELVERTARGR